MGEQLLLTGAAGFVGGAVARELVRRGHARRLRVVCHHRPVRVPGGGPMATVRADLARPETLRGLCDGIDTLVHAAVLIGGDEATSTAVNHAGTAALMREARNAGVRRIIHVSTAAVYGDGPHVAATEECPPAPTSPTSRSRLAAEREVLAAGGTVLRPMFILGAGDTWFLPNVLRMTRWLEAWVDEGRALLSGITVDALATVLADLATGDRALAPGTVYHANHPQPLPVRSLVSALAESIGQEVPAPSSTLDPDAALKQLPAQLGRHMIRLFAVDHWFDSTRLWQVLGTDPGATPLERIPEYRDWYLSQLSAEQMQ